MNFGLKLDNLPEHFALKSGDERNATVTYSGKNPLLNGSDGVFEQIQNATGARKVYPTSRSYVGREGGLELQLSMDR